MTVFVWVDRSGARHDLDSCAPIEVELAEIDAVLKAFVADLISEDETTWRAAMNASEPHVLRRNVLVVELQRWNDHADAQALEACAVMREEIGRLIGEAAFVERLHGCYREWQDRVRSGSPEGPATNLQRGVIAQAAAILGLVTPAIATFRNAHGWLMGQPATNRTALPASEPAFVWSDRHGHAHQLRSLIPIEAEHCAIVRELAEMADDLRPDAPPATRLLTLERASTRGNRIQILKHQQQGWVEHVTTIERKAARRRAGEIGGE